MHLWGALLGCTFSLNLAVDLGPVPALFSSWNEDLLQKMFKKLTRVTLTFRLQVTKRQTRSTVKTIPAATPVTMTTIEPAADPPKSKPVLLPVTAFESVTPETKCERIL